MTAYSEWAADLRRAATLLDELSPDLPAPQYAGQRLYILIGLPEQGDVTQAGKVIGEPVQVRHPWQSATETEIGSVTVEWYWHDSAMAAEMKPAEVSK